MPTHDKLGLRPPAIGGRFVVCGLMGGSTMLSIPILALREIAIIGSAMGNTANLVELVDLVKRGEIKLPAVERRPLAAVDQCLDELAAGRILGRVVLDIDENG